MGRRKEGRQWGEEVRTLLLNVQPTIPYVYLFFKHFKDRKQM